MDFEREEQESEETPAGSKKNWPVIAGIGVVLVLLILGLALVLFSGKSGHSTDSASDGETEDVQFVEDPDRVLTGALYSLDPFLVNLGSEDTFITLEMDVEFFDFEVPENIKGKLPAVRDRIISVLAKKKQRQILAPSGREALRVELLLEINKALRGKNPVVDLYFRELFVQ